MLITDLDGAVLHANPSALRGLGVEPGQTPKNIRELVAPERRQHLSQDILPTVRQAGAWRGETLWQRRTPQGIETFDTSAIWLLQAARNDEYGQQPARMIVFARDVTTRVQAEQAIRDSERNMRLMFEQTPVPLLAVDRAGVIAAEWSAPAHAAATLSSSLSGAGCAPSPGSLSKIGFLPSGTCAGTSSSAASPVPSWPNSLEPHAIR